ncbi:MAG: hypothetical protein WA873_01030 [Jannaschia helgolandensis]
MARSTSGNARTLLLDIAQRQAGGAGVATMADEDVARAVLHLASVPEGTNVLTMTIMANSDALWGRARLTCASS